VARFHFEYMDLPLTTPGFVTRKDGEDELPFDPKTLAPRNPESQEPVIDLEAEPPIAATIARRQPEENDDEAERLQLDEPVEEELVLVPSFPGVPEDTAQAEGDQEPQTSFPFQQ